MVTHFVVEMCSFSSYSSSSHQYQGCRTQYSPTLFQPNTVGADSFEDSFTCQRIHTSPYTNPVRTSANSSYAAFNDHSTSLNRHFPQGTTYIAMRAEVVFYPFNKTTLEGRSHSQETTCLSVCKFYIFTQISSSFL